MNAVSPWSIEDMADSEEEGFGKVQVIEPVRFSVPIGGSWRVVEQPAVTTRLGQAFPLARTFTPRAVQTLMTDKHLRDHGVRVHRHQEQAWLVSLDADTLDEERPSDRWFAAVTERIGELRALAVEEEAFSEDSAREALAFARELKATRRPGVFLIGNGNVRLLWTEADEQIGLQFRGDGSIQYVLFARRRGNRITTHMGDDDSGGILRQITAAGLRHLLGNL